MAPCEIREVQWRVDPVAAPQTVRGEAHTRMDPVGPRVRLTLSSKWSDGTRLSIKRLEWLRRNSTALSRMPPRRPRSHHQSTVAAAAPRCSQRTQAFRLSDRPVRPETWSLPGELPMGATAANRSASAPCRPPVARVAGVSGPPVPMAKEIEV
jgi:hypothetical protein